MVCDASLEPNWNKNRRLRKRWRTRGVWLLCSFYHGSWPTSIKTIVNKFAISNHTTLILSVHALRISLKLICEYELRSLPNKKVSGAKDHGKSYIKVRPPLVRHLLRNCLLHKNVPSLLLLNMLQHYTHLSGRTFCSNRQTITLKMADQGRSELHVILTTINFLFGKI